MLVGVLESSGIDNSGTAKSGFRSFVPKSCSFAKPLIINVCALSFTSVWANLTYNFGETSTPSTIEANSVSSAGAYVLIVGLAS